jgi:hypothetical protein
MILPGISLIGREIEHSQRFLPALIQDSCPDLNPVRKGCWNVLCCVNSSETLLL